MKTVNDIPELFDTQDSNDKRILINIPDESQPFILLDYNHCFDWTIEQYDGEIELTLLDRDTRTVIRRSYPDYQQIITDGQNIMVLSSRTADRLERYRREAAVDGVVMQFKRANGLGNYTWSDIRCIDEDHSIAVIEACESHSWSPQRRRLFRSPSRTHICSRVSTSSIRQPSRRHYTEEY